MTDGEGGGKGQTRETLVTFATGATTGSGTVQRVEPLGDDRFVVVVDETPFHPVDHTWPDQPGDTGKIEKAEVTSSLMAAVAPNGALILGEDIPARRGDPGWTWCVAHVVADGDWSVGQRVRLQVDERRRDRLSASHTACHLAALALNAAAASLWRKDVRADSLGRPDLDQLAIVSSVMDEEGSTDVYRFGKSLRKKGFDASGFVEAVPALVTQVEETLAGWTASGAVVRVDDEGDRRLTSPRRWTCELPEATASMPCGGTHVASLAVLGGVHVDYAVGPEGAGLTVRSRRAAIR